jgi:outer membrane protein, multidrug efflux system
MALPAQWAVPGAASPSQGELPPWGDFVRDPTLRRLVEQALVHNRDLRVAVLQIELARAQWQGRGAEAFPNLQAGVTASRQSSGEDQPIRSSVLAGLVVSNWEIDFFGRLASLEEAARAQLLASEQAASAVQTSLVAAVATAWFNLQGSQAQAELAQQTLTARAESLRLVRLRHDLGAASALELRSAESLEASARATLVQQQRQRQLDLNLLTQLVGQAFDRPLDLAGSQGGASRLELDAALAPLPVGLPSQVLLQRPDVRAAEQQLLAADAQIQAARAAFFPRISLTASLGSASTELSGLFRAGSLGWTVAPQALLPIFDGGRNRAGLASARTGRELALAQYEKAIQSAFREVNDGLAGDATLGEQLRAQQALVTAESERLRLAELRLQQGVAAQLEVLDAQRALFAAQQSLLQTRLALAQNRVALYKALGGGWRAPA